MSGGVVTRTVCGINRSVQSSDFAKLEGVSIRQMATYVYLHNQLNLWMIYRSARLPVYQTHLESIMHVEAKFKMYPKFCEGIEIYKYI